MGMTTPKRALTQQLLLPQSGKAQQERVDSRSEAVGLQDRTLGEA